MKSIHQSSKIALGSEATLTFVSEAVHAPGIESRLWEKVDAFERSFSRFLPGSELTKFNSKSGQKVAISLEFVAILIVAKQMSEETDGMYNPFILPALQRAGYTRSWVNKDLKPIDYSHLKVVDYDQLEIGADYARIPEGTALDLGGCGKGYLLDRLADYLESIGIVDYWFSLGGDILARGGETPKKPWQIAVAKAGNPSETLTSIKIPYDKRISIATSGVTKRQGVHNGEKWHHIIDSSTGKPAVTDILTATVCSPYGISADVFASCVVTLGSEKSRNFIEEHKISRAIMQTTLPKSEVIVVGTFSDL